MLTASNYPGTIEGCENYGNISAYEVNFVANQHFIGVNSSQIIVQDCHFEGVITSSNSESSILGIISYQYAEYFYVSNITYSCDLLVMLMFDSSSHEVSDMTTLKQYFTNVDFDSIQKV